MISSVLANLYSKLDDRNLDFTGDDNLFIEGCMNFKVMHNIEELKRELEKE